VPDTWVPTRTDVTGFTVPEAVTIATISPLVTFSVLNWKTVPLLLKKRNPATARNAMITIPIPIFFLHKIAGSVPSQ
jgi:hypothetical protein